MNKRRFRVKDGNLIGRDGRVHGKIESLTLSLDELESEPVQDRLMSEGDVVKSVWEHYVGTMKVRSVGLDPQARAVIRDALKVATADECKRAIDGCFASDFHMKRGEYAGRSGRKYNALSQILKGKRGGRTTREQIDFFLDIADSSTSGVLDPSADPVRIRDAKKDVLAAHEFPEDEHLAQRSEQARQWLQEQGWVIGARPEDGWPTFTPPQQQ